MRQTCVSVVEEWFLLRFRLLFVRLWRRGTEDEDILSPEAGKGKSQPCPL